MAETVTVDGPTVAKMAATVSASRNRGRTVDR
jgi:hypothetical protein